MLIKLTADDISTYWEFLKHAIEQALPPVVGCQVDRMNNILQSALIGTLDIWVTKEEVRGKNTITSVIATTFLTDSISQTKSLLVYCVHHAMLDGEETIIQRPSWLDAVDGIMRYAKKAGAQRTIAYSDNRAILALAKRSGADTRYTFISYDLTGG